MHDCQSPGELLPCTKWLREHLLRWFEQHRRSFHWREPGRSAYELTVAEILLQRTTAAAAARAFPELVARYPTWGEMAGADLEDLQEALRPLGLWRQRSRALLGLAAAIEKLGGELPRSRRELERLPGVGPYTASALLSAVYGFHEPLVDVNMARVLGRFFGLQVHARGVRDASLRALAADLVRGERSLSVNWAVLDMGALVCRARNPLCGQCPLRGECRFFEPGLLPNRAEPTRRSQA